ncbi:hypothetical protein M436DRAFT_43413 [Aureobasidium namibiae CBS 147.97]|uniref:Uncharacterized protein n=1 Tax=Aureobasidium namibiae CBS 147.97 TaxID=1043004 RepID=A0A074WSW9_9PEZI|nr:uncharacterized protein M436DRAFT_43413 [Aureobasidium namibiae CBS 147.97]KEQ74634.1 hypothetical protein M436DRAFT_43413 [Aureobasidium namibiae CBS 147.97]
MSTPPAAKRRRVDSLGIHKPFVSPLKRDPSTTGQTTSTGDSAGTANLASTHQDIKALEARIRFLRSQNGILAQAAQITAPTPQASQSSQQASQPSQSSHQHQPQTRLTRLSQKWLRASQSAAEEVFVSFEQSIKDNGGFSTFLAQQKKQSTSNSFFNDNFDDEREKVNEGNEDNWRDEEGDVLTERGKRQRRGEIEEQGHKYKRKGDEDEAKEEDGEEEQQELTLGVMLKVLNIDPEVIGWDAETLAWK